MPDLFGVNIAGIIGQAMDSGLLPVTLTKVTPGVRSTTDPTAGTNEVRKTYQGCGFIDDYKDYQINETTIRRGDRKILVTGNSLRGIVPITGDEIKIEGVSYTIIKVLRDPAAATYTCQVRGQ